MAAPALNYGLFIALALAILTLIIYLSGLIAETRISYLNYLILLLGAIFSILKYRDEHSGGFISYGRALGFGTLSAFFASVFFAVFTYIFYRLIAPDAIEQLRVSAEINMLEADPDATDQQIDMVLRFINPFILAITSVFSVTFMGFIFSLVAAAFLKKSPPAEEAPEA